MASDLAHRLVRVRTTIAKYQAECAAWFPKEVAQWSADWEWAGERYDQEQFGAASEQLRALETRIDQAVAKSRDLAAKHQARMYLLRAVRQVCCNLGMREVVPPRQEQLDDASSRILLTVGSPDRGRLSLALTLEGIQTHGEAQQCLKDLDQLSEHLAAGYGIQTKFRTLADHDEPALTGGRQRRLPAETDECGHACGG